MKLLALLLAAIAWFTILAATAQSNRVRADDEISELQ